MRTTFTTWRVALTATLLGLISGRAQAQMPDNDDIGDARVIPLMPFADIVDVGQATGDPSDPGFEGAVPTVWYKVRPFTDLPLSLDLSLSDSPMIAVVFADPPGVDTVMDGGPQIDSLLLEGQQTYWVMVFPEFDNTPDEARPRGKAVLLSSLAFEPLPPPNDDLADATPIEALPFAEIANLSLATAGPEDPDPGFNTLWYTLTPTEDVLLRCRLAAPSGESVLVAFTDPPSLETAVQWGVANPAAAFRMILAAGTTYRLMLANSEGAPVILAIDGARPVPNDLRERATVMDALPFAEVLDVTTATASVGDVFGEAEELAPTVWYRFTPTETMWVALDVWERGPGERQVRVMRAGAAEPMAELVYGDGPGRVRLEAGVTYDFMVALFGDPAPLVFSAWRVFTAPNDERASPAVIGALPYADWSSAVDYDLPPTGDPADPIVLGALVTRWYRYTPAADVRVSLAPTDPTASDAVLFVFDSELGAGSPWAIGAAIDDLTLGGGRTYEIMLAHEDPSEHVGLLVTERVTDTSAAGSLSVTNMTPDLLGLGGRALLGCESTCPGDDSFRLRDSEGYDLGAEPTLELPGLRPDLWEIGWDRLASFDADGFFNSRVRISRRLVTVTAGQPTELDLEVPTPATVRALVGPIQPHDGDFFHNALVLVEAHGGAATESTAAVAMVSSVAMSEAFVAAIADTGDATDLTPMVPWQGAPPTLVPLEVGVPAGVPLVIPFRFLVSIRGLGGDLAALLTNLLFHDRSAPPARTHSYGTMRVAAVEREPIALAPLAPGEVAELTLEIERPAVAALTIHPPPPQAPQFVSSWQATNAWLPGNTETALVRRFAFAVQPDGSPYPADLRIEIPAGVWLGGWSIEEVEFDVDGIPHAIGGGGAELDVEVDAGDTVDQTPGAPFTWNLSPEPGEVCEPVAVFTGTVTDPDGVVEVLVNGVPASISLDDSFVAWVPLELGDNVVTLEARDTNDEWVERTRTWRYTVSDGDGDGLSDCRERELVAVHACLAIDDRDSDDDGLADGDELARGADPCAPDSDGDGCGDAIDPTPVAADTAECLALIGGFRAQVQDEPPGAHCAEGGQRVGFGTDDNGDGALSPDEVERTIYVCDERARTLLGISPLAPGVACPAGGYRLDVAADLDGDLSIDRPGEVLSSFEVCDGVDGADGADGLTSLAATRVLPAGATCPAGGIELRHGLDDDRDGVLDEAEVDQVSALCHGRDGEDGADGRDALVVVTPEPPGAACATGGQRIDVGLDDDRDGVLDAAEIDATSRVCNGLTGDDGAAGADGQDGTAALVTVSPEPEGARCAQGGQRLDLGLDLDRDGVLDAEEVVSSAWVCDGVDAEDGHTTLVAMSEVAPGEECAAGGLRLESGTDDDRDGALAAGEVDDTRVLCRAEDGLTALVSITEEPAGEHCPTGGQRVQAGLDDDRDGVLEADEVDQTSYVCNGAVGGPGEAGEDGDGGSDGASALVVLDDVAPGEACPGGGVEIRSGLDTDRDGVLGADETTDTRVVCDGVSPAAKDGGCHGGGITWAPLGLLVLGLRRRRRPQRKSGV